MPLQSKSQEFAWAQHVNPDGSVGGQVSTAAFIDPTATISQFAVVLPGAVVAAHQIVRDGDVVVPGGGIIRFDASQPAQKAGQERQAP